MGKSLLQFFAYMYKVRSGREYCVFTGGKLNDCETRSFQLEYQRGRYVELSTLSSRYYRYLTCCLNPGISRNTHLEKMVGSDMTLGYLNVCNTQSAIPTSELELTTSPLAIRG